MAGDIAIVFDCGATNARVIALDSNGKIISSASEPNSPCPDPLLPGGLIWDFGEIWKKMSRASARVMSDIDSTRVAGVTVTTFGVDGTLFDHNGLMLYPVISWQCERTRPVVENIGKYISSEELYMISGVLPFSFNTIFKLIWLRENRPVLCEKAKCFLFAPSILAYFLTGSMVNDRTMAGTSMTTDLTTGGWSGRIYDAIGFPSGLMLDPVDPGTITGTVTAAAAAVTGLPCGTPVVATGHDTQFALFGSGAGVNVPVLSSGTWEILMVRSKTFSSGMEQMNASITTELDSRKGLYDIGNQWIASGMIEWVRRKYYPELKENAYDIMISGASKVPPSCNGVTANPDFSKPELENAIRGMTSRTTRDDILRAVLTALSERLRQGKEAIENAGSFNTSFIICVGGGSRNKLWNQMRADTTGVIIRTGEMSEATALGASTFVQYAAGNASSPEEALSNVNVISTDYYPGER